MGLRIYYTLCMVVKRLFCGAYIHVLPILFALQYLHECVYCKISASTWRGDEATEIATRAAINTTYRRGNGHRKGDNYRKVDGRDRGT